MKPTKKHENLFVLKLILSTKSNNMSGKFHLLLLIFTLITTVQAISQPKFIPEDKRIKLRQEWFALQREAGSKNISIPKLQKPQNSTQSTGFQFIGPTNAAGRMTCVAIHPQNHNLWLAGAAAGGVWQTFNRGISWQQLSANDFPTLAVGSIAFNPKNPNQILVGTGEPNFAYNNYAGYGILRSENGGITWKKSGLFGSISKIIFHPTDSAIVFATCAGAGGFPGIFRSLDNGVTWNLILNGTTAMDIAIAPNSPNVIFAVLSYPYGDPMNGIYKSDDKGETWNKLKNLPTNCGRSCISFANPNKLIVLMSDENGAMNGLFVSANLGNTFTKITNAPANLFGNDSQAWYDIACDISPINSQNIILGGVHPFQTTDGGNSWSEIANVHEDIHAISFFAPDSAIIATDGGIYLINNGIASYRSGNLTTTQFYGFSVTPFGQILGGTQDNGAFFYANATWNKVLGGDVMKAYIHPEYSNMLFLTTPYGFVWKSQTSGQSWNPSSNGINFSEPSVWVTPFIPSRTSGESNIIYTATSRVYRTEDFGATWTVFSPFLADSSMPITALAQSTKDGSVIIAASENGKVFMTNNTGITWNTISDSLPNRYPTSLTINPADKRFFIATYSGYGTPHIWKTTDQGQTWRKANSNLPDIPVNCFAFDTYFPATNWFAGTDNGLYFTNNAGASWNQYMEGIGIAPILDMQIIPSTKDIYLATYGMGIFKISQASLPVELADFSAKWRGNDILLNWQTVSEQNSGFFELERKIDSENDFRLSTKLLAAGNSTTRIIYNFTDNPPESASIITYRLKLRDASGESRTFPEITLARDENTALLAEYSPMPNPFSEAIEIHYTLLKTADVTLSLHDIFGRNIRTIFQNIHHNSGNFIINWDGNDEQGAKTSSGVYFVCLTINGNRNVFPVMKAGN